VESDGGGEEQDVDGEGDFEEEDDDEEEDDEDDEDSELSEDFDATPFDHDCKAEVADISRKYSSISSTTS
jgi:hypothetical protein